MRKLKVAVVGCGRISVMHFVSTAQSQFAELVACCDVKAERAKEKAEKYGVKAYTDYVEMFDKEDLDGVHLCLPHYLHSKVACAAFERGIAVLCEKPIVDYKPPIDDMATEADYQSELENLGVNFNA